MKRQFRWSEENGTVSAYVPKTTLEKLIKMADDRTKAEGKYCSVSRLVRDILIKETSNDGRLSEQ